jgi:multidrug efflux pump
MGVIPLVVSTGAGAEMRAAMGIAVFSGMIGVTFFGIFMTPVFYVLARRITGNKALTQHVDEAHAQSVHEAEEAMAVMGRPPRRKTRSLLPAV